MANTQKEKLNSRQVKIKSDLDFGVVNPLTYDVNTKTFSLKIDSSKLDIDSSGKLTVKLSSVTAWVLEYLTITGSLTIGSLTGIVKAVAGAISAIAIGTANQILGVNSAGNNYEYKTINQGTNVTVTHATNSITIASDIPINTQTDKPTPLDADVALIESNADSWAKRKLTWANIKATLKTYFDGIYQAVLGYTAEDVANKSTDTALGASDTLYPTQNAVKTYVDSGGGGATAALDNLASVAINTSLVSDIDNTDDLGSSAKKWKDGYFAGNVIVNTNIYSVDWTDYAATSTINGWSSFTAGKKWIRYKKIGKTVFVAFHLEGTSDLNRINFTLPYNSVNTGAAGIQTALGFGYDNGTALTTTGKISIDSNSNFVEVFTKNDGTSAGQWTNSGTKIVAGQFWYEIA